jgi:hypothetical protein
VGEADGLDCVGEGEPGGDGGGLQGAVLFAAVPTAALPVTGRDVAPGQVRDLGVQAGLVCLQWWAFLSLTRNRACSR